MNKLFALLLCLVCCSCDSGRENSIPANHHKMTYLIFPQEGSTIDRAIIVSGKELFSGKPIEYYVGNDLHEIPYNKISLLPMSKNNYFSYVHNLNLEIKKWGSETDYEKVDFKLQDNNVVLVIYHKNGKRIIYKYKIKSPTEPEECKIILRL